MLTWIVSCRRAVVSAECSYTDALREWHAALVLPEHRVKLISWYELPAPDRYGWATGWLADWIERLEAWGQQSASAGAAPESRGSAMNLPARRANPSRHAVTTQLRNTFDTNGSGPWPRLWKGPLRVVNRPSSGESWWNFCREVEPRSPQELRDFRFRPGDVVEFPLFKFLGSCFRRSEERNRYWWGLCFNRSGSFLLGNSVVNAAGSLPAAPADRLHDNLLAMRFQLLLGLAYAAFYHDQPVFAGAGPVATSGGDSVYGRGFLYAGVLVKAVGQDPGGRVVWRVFNNMWVYKDGNGICNNLPGAAGVNALAPAAPITPGWSCSPCTLFLTFLLLDRPDYGPQSVASSCAAIPDYAAQIDQKPAADFVYRYLHLPTPLPSSNGPSRDLRPHLPQVTAVALEGHEFGLVKLFPAGDLLRSASRPFTGRLAAYDPLTGRAWWPEGVDAAQGQLYYFEARGSLGRRTVSVPPPPVGAQRDFNRFGCTAFRWEPVANNELRFVAKNNALWIENRSQFLDRVMMVSDDALATASERAQEFRPIVIRAYGNSTQTNGDNWDRGSHIVGDYPSQYAERALPSPTMGEMSTHFASIAQVKTTVAQMKTLLNAHGGPGIAAFTNAL